MDTEGPLAKFNKRNLPKAAMSFLGAAVLVSLGLALVVGSFFTPVAGVVVWSSKLAGFGLALILAAAAPAMGGVATLFERDWGEVEVPTLSPAAYLEALTATAPPAWTCTRCRVVLPQRGLGSCIYCDSGVQCYAIDDDRDLQMVIASLG